MALWIIKLALVTLGGLMLVAVISVVRASVVDRGKCRDESQQDRAGEREQKWYPLH